jgi:hypothetical protein
MMEMLNTIEINHAESNVRRAQLRLDDAENHLMIAREQKRIVDLIQNLSQGNQGTACSFDICLN